MLIEDLLKIPGVIEPETLHKLFPKLNNLERQQVLVIKLLRETRQAYEDMDVFENVCLVLNGINPDVGKTEGCLPEFIWKALDIIQNMHPNLELSFEVTQYIKFMFIDNGYTFFHPFANIDDSMLDVVKDKAGSGPFPLEEDRLGIQAAKYLKIMEYIK